MTLWCRYIYLLFFFINNDTNNCREDDDVNVVEVGNKKQGAQSDRD